MTNFPRYKSSGNHPSCTAKGQMAQRLAGQLCDRVGEGRSQRRQARFAHAGRLFGTRHDVDIERGSADDARHEALSRRQKGYLIQLNIRSPAEGLNKSTGLTATAWLLTRISPAPGSV